MKKKEECHATLLRTTSSQLRLQNDLWGKSVKQWKTWGGRSKLRAAEEPPPQRFPLPVLPQGHDDGHVEGLLEVDASFGRRLYVGRLQPGGQVLGVGGRHRRLLVGAQSLQHFWIVDEVQLGSDQDHGDTEALYFVGPPVAGGVERGGLHQGEAQYEDVRSGITEAPQRIEEILKRDAVFNRRYLLRTNYVEQQRGLFKCRRETWH